MQDKFTNFKSTTTKKNMQLQEIMNPIYNPPKYLSEIHIYLVFPKYD